jgi:DNA repair exonuclease SbcCD nuclease subunit
MKILRAGDPHVRPTNIGESHKVMEMVRSLALSHKVDRIEILGDLLHTHAIIRLEVLEFWSYWLRELAEIKETLVLVGNHDMVGDHNSISHSLSVFQQDLALQSRGLTIVDAPMTRGIYAYLPYYHDKEHFLTSAKYLADHENAKVLVCHQTITGAQYDNGFYAPDGIDPSLIPFDLIFSGHIHKHQILQANGKTVIYPGTSRWDSASDVNEQKGLWLYDHDDLTGALNTSQFFSTAKICKPMVSVSWTQGEDMPKLPEGDATLYIELIGTSDWIKEQKTRFLGKASIKTKITDSKSTSRKVGGDLAHFLENVFQTSMDRNALLKFMQEEDLV